MSIAYGIIGCQHAHIEIFIEQMEQLGHRCAGIYERDNKLLAESMAAKYKLPIAANAESLLGPEIALIGSSAINSEKIDIVELCEQYGKSIMLDKPAVVNRRDLQRLEAVIKRGRIEVGMLLTERFHPAIYTLKQLIDEQQLGEIVAISMRKPHRLNAASRPGWFFDKAQCGGILIDLLIHDYDLLAWLTGNEVVSSTGTVGKNVLPEHPTFYNTVNVQVTMDDGVVMQLYADWHTAEHSWTWGDGRIFVTGTRGFAELRLNGEPQSGSAPMLLLVNDQLPWHEAALRQPPVTITADFLQRVNGAASSQITHQHILQAHQAVMMADEQVEYAVTPYKG